MNNITLTAEELELVQNKRNHEAELEAKKLEAVETQFLKSKSEAEVRVAKQIAKGNDQVESAEKFAQDLGSDYKIIVETKSILDKAYKLDYNTREVLDTYEVPGKVKHARIERDGYVISVIEHHSNSGRWSMRSTNHGFKMYVNGPGIDYKTRSRGYKNTKKVNELINDSISSIKADQEHKNNLRNAIEQTIGRLSAEYPTATVTSGKNHKYNPYSRTNRFTEYDCITVALENGITVAYRIYSDGSLSQESITYPEMSNETMLGILSKITVA